ncbi:MAG: peptidyl-prolyl cis-trans isomerase [Rhodanobacteraceae bacterium]|nr:peptidyl-prolyl cis-trans isomerase [Rhodanobacteraceae bacterium]
MFRTAAAIVLMSLAATGWAQTPNPKVLIKTNQGDITVELDAAKAPKSVENFVAYVKAGQYDGTIFHRVIDNFMIQGGGYTTELVPKGGERAPIQNEATNGLSNLRGTLAMARTMDPHSATSQFFINVVDNKALDHVSTADGRTWGYAVFGKVISGMEVVDKIKVMPTSRFSPEFANLPRPYVVIEKATLVEEAAAKPAQ